MNISSRFLWRFFNQIHCSLQRCRSGPESGGGGLRSGQESEGWTGEWETSLKVCGEYSSHDVKRWNFQKLTNTKGSFGIETTQKHLS